MDIIDGADHGHSGIAIVGASPDCFWSRMAIRNLREYNYAGSIWPVNPYQEEVGGLKCYPGIKSLPARPAVAMVLVRNDRCAQIVADAVELEVPDLVVISDGFAERGQYELQEELTALVRDSRSTMFGPNCVGFVDLAKKVCAIGEPIPLDVDFGPISFISQSGALLSSFMSACTEEGLGLDWCVSIGNGAFVDMGVALEIAVERTTTSVVCLYAESLGRDSERFARALDRATALGKRVLVFKAGSSAAASNIAWTHTGSMVGADHLVTSFLAAHGAIRVDSFGELVRLASICSMLPEAPRGGGIAVVGKSGGIATLAADSAHRHGLQLADLEAGNQRRITDGAPKGSFVGNPFDIVGLGDDDALWRAIFEDPNVGFVVAPHPVIYPDGSDDLRRHREAIRSFRELASQTRKPTFSTTALTQAWTPWIEGLRDERTPYWALGRDLDLTLQALAKLFPKRDVQENSGNATAPGGELLPEEEARHRLGLAGLPLVQGVTFASAAEVTLAGLRPPVVVKVLAEGLSHKAKAGGVRLGCGSAGEARAAAQDAVAAVSAAVGADAVQAVRVEEMIWGPELLVGLQRDPFLGCHLTLGIGGTLAEGLRALRTRMLPISGQQIREELAALHLESVLTRQMDALVAVIARLTAEFLDGSLGDLQSIEINPLMVAPDGPCIVDILMVR
jgi:acyl-CoA synthetase (NDP forming)